MNEQKQYGNIGGPAGHRWFVHEKHGVRCECGVHFRERVGLAPHLRLEALLAK